MLDFLIKFFPAMVANASPVIYSKLPLNRPINEKLFGKNKTWFGFVFGVLSGGLVGYLISSYFPTLNLYNSLTMSFGALLGDLIKSFFKRRCGISEGKDWVPFDQIDWIIGGVAFSFYLFSFYEILLLFISLPFLHVLTNKIAKILKLK
jgi:CDP-2,3-bis-(O-geranylgeranyl)-sn-glycerol synthase